VSGWSDRVSVTEKQKSERLEGVTHYLNEIESRRIYREFAAQIMHGKSFVLNEAEFYQYAERAAEFYLKTPEEKQDALNIGLWKENSESPLEDFTPVPVDDPTATLFTLDGETFSIQQFEQMLQTHPLLFREKSIGYSEFPEQLKYAIADVIRDHYLTRETYRRGYEKLPAIQSTVKQWQDYYLAANHRAELLNSRQFSGDFNSEYMPALEMILNPYIDNLQEKYSDQIQINTDQFEALELTDVDMFVAQPFAPYPQVVPRFPVYTTDDRLDYGKRLIIESKTDH